MNNIFEVLKALTHHEVVDADTYTDKYMCLYDTYGEPSKTMSYFDYDGGYILHMWNTGYGEEYLWVMKDSSGKLSYLMGSKKG